MHGPAPGGHSWAARALAALCAGLLAWHAPASAQTSSSDRLDPAAAKARVVLEQHCARCHEKSALRLPAPAADLGDILDVTRLAADPSLVVPGNADASPLYRKLMTREMPPDIDLAAADQLPSASEIGAVREWIEGLPPTSPSCPDRQPIAAAALAGAVAEALQRAADKAGDLRFVSLAHFHNACVGEKLIAGYRQGVVKLLNSLSTAGDPARLVAGGPADSLIVVRLSELGWTAANWDMLAEGADGAALPPLPGGVAQRAGTMRPVLPADWLAARAVTPKAYRELLAQPDTLEMMLQQLGVEPAKEGADSVRRVAVRRSAVTRANRMIEQRAHPDGDVWLAYDFTGSGGRRDVFATPQGPATAAGDAAGFRPDAVRVIYMLPNGFPAYALYDAAGRLVDAMPPGEAAGAPLDPAGRSAGLACLGCHSAGAHRAADELRGLIASASSIDRATRDAILQLHVPAAEMEAAFAEALGRTRGAMTKAGVDPDLTILGVEPVAALAKAYRAPVTLARAAAEQGGTGEALLQRLRKVQGEALPVATRLERAALPRGEAERLYAALAGRALPAVAAAPEGPAPQSWDLSLLADRPVYQVGDLARFTVRSSLACNLTLISVNVGGKATVVFPNDFEPDNALQAAQELRIPADNAPYRLRLAEAGQERMVAVCTSRSKMADGIVQDYERQRFTALGHWGNFLSGLLEAEEKGSRPEEKPDARTKGGRAPARARDEASPRRTLREPQARTAITIRVEPPW